MYIFDYFLWTNGDTVLCNRYTTICYINIIVLSRRGGVYPRPIKRVDRNGWRTLLLPVIFLGADKETFIRREVIYLR